ncbi:duodenase-1-like [Emydura macquarii macquarii]|uniref:duodenase-1-like n=1 Tax=Emydura macquarii macquarii TaxID=1129001 RepID=UPI00352AD994
MGLPEPSNIFVHLGVWDIKNPGQTGQRIWARRWIQHPDFNNENLDNDIILIKLSHGAELSEWVGPIPLPEADHHVRPGSQCSVARWGRTGVNTTTDRLQQAEQEVVLDRLCRERYRHYNPSTMLCASNTNTKKAAFEGDSGGPLVCKGKVPGIVLHGKRTTLSHGVFTKIISFLPLREEIEEIDRGETLHLSR